MKQKSAASGPSAPAMPARAWPTLRARRACRARSWLSTPPRKAEIEIEVQAAHRGLELLLLHDQRAAGAEVARRLAGRRRGGRAKVEIQRRRRGAERNVRSAGSRRRRCAEVEIERGSSRCRRGRGHSRCRRHSARCPAVETVLRIDRAAKGGGF